MSELMSFIIKTILIPATTLALCKVLINFNLFNYLWENYYWHSVVNNLDAEDSLMNSLHVVSTTL